jgi:hypothetical protein
MFGYPIVTTGYAHRNDRSATTFLFDRRLFFPGLTVGGASPRAARCWTHRGSLICTNPRRTPFRLLRGGWGFDFISMIRETGVCKMFPINSGRSHDRHVTYEAEMTPETTSWSRIEGANRNMPGGMTLSRRQYQECSIPARHSNRFDMIHIAI